MISDSKIKGKKRVFCAGKCGTPLAKPEVFPKGTYCSIYCCSCCPDSKRFPCQMEVREGTFLEKLSKFQN